MAEYNTFRCPSCGQFVNDTMTSCRFCFARLDADTAMASMDLQTRLDEAYRSASNTRILAGAMTTFFFVGFIPFVGFVATWAFRVTFLLIPILLIVWFVKYHSLNKNLPEISDARKYLFTTLGIWAIYPAVYILLVMLVLLGVAAVQLSR